MPIDLVINKENMIYKIRWKQVIIDSDSVWLFNIETRILDQTIKK